MATGLLWADGFDLYNTGAQGWDQGGFGGTISTSYRRGSYGQGYRADEVARRLVAPDGSAKTHVIAAAAIKMTSNNVWDSRNGRAPLLSFYSADYSSPQASFYVRVNGAVGFLRGISSENDTAIGETASGVWKYGVWNFVEFRVKFSNTVGEIEIKINGNQVVNLTSQDTCKQTAESADLFQLYNGTYSNIVDFDDCYMVDYTVGGAFLGDCVVRGVLPTSDGNYTDWTGTYADVDENPPVDDTDHIESSTVGHKESFVAADTELTTATVKAVGVRWRGRKTDGATRTQKALIRHSSTDATGSDVTVGSNFLTYQALFDNVPGGTGWTLSEAHAAQPGVQVVA